MKANGQSILVVDDDKGLLRLVEKALTRNGYRVETQDSGQGALAWLEKNFPDLLLLDLKLQDFEAKEFITRLNAAKRLPPFIIITGQGDERVAVEMMKTGALDYVVKDAQFYEVLPTVVSRTISQIDRDKQLAKAEEALRVSEERFRVALKHSPIFVFTQDTDLRYTWVHNAPGEESENSLLGKMDSDMFPAREADRLIQIKLRALATGIGLRQEVACTINGTKRVFDMTVEPIKEGLQVVGITGAALDITEHKRLENEVLQISEMQQRRIGQDLHDGICQHLAGIELMTEALGQKLGVKAKAQVEGITAQIRDVISQTRSLARGLSPLVLESEGLMAALGELAANTQKLFQVNCRFKCSIPVRVEDLTASTHLFRIAQEAVNNAVKHGKAQEIEIVLEATREKTVLAVRDNGTGIQQTAAPQKGMGMRIMQYRASMIGATILVQNQKPTGAAVVCFLPHPSSNASGTITT